MDAMKLRNPWLIRLAAFLGALLVRLWIATLHYRIDFRLSGPQPVDPRKQRILYAFWHETILAAFRAARENVEARMLISQHADGELVAQIVEFLGVATVRGSSTR